MSAVLFICGRYAGRSLMAEALFNSAARQRGLKIRAESAGTDPAKHPHDVVVDAMRERGLDLSQARPKTLTNEMVLRTNRVITMGCDPDSSSCPALLLADVEDWELPDPNGRAIEEVRAIRDEIGQRIEELLSRLRPGAGPEGRP